MPKAGRTGRAGGMPCPHPQHKPKAPCAPLCSAPKTLAHLSTFDIFVTCNRNLTRKGLEKLKAGHRSAPPGSVGQFGPMLRYRLRWALKTAVHRRAAHQEARSRPHHRPYAAR